MSQVYYNTGNHQGLPLGQLAVCAGCKLHHFLDHFPLGVKHSANAQTTAQQSQGMPSSTVQKGNFRSKLAALYQGGAVLLAPPDCAGTRKRIA